MFMEIRRLSPALCGDYLRFFDETPHDDNRDESKCYCVCWSAADSTGRDFSSAEKRRALAEEYVVSGDIRGYLAYENGRAIGWCSAGDRGDYYACHAGRMYLEPLRALYPPDERVKSVYCFVVAPEWRRHGVAAALLERVCEDARAEGFDAVEAYPIAQFVSEQADYMGPAALYERLGFAVWRELGDRLIVRRALR